MNKVAYKKTTWATFVDWFQISIVVSLIGGCVYWLDQDDKRMYKEYVAGCEQRKTLGLDKADRNCAEAFRKAYYETFGR